MGDKASGRRETIKKVRPGKPLSFSRSDRSCWTSGLLVEELRLASWEL